MGMHLNNDNLTSAYLTDAQDPWTAGLPCYTRDESAQDAVQQPPHKKQRKHTHSTDDAKSSDEPDPPVPAKPAAPSVLSSAFRSCSPPEPPPPTVGWATGSVLLPDPRCQGGELGRDWLPDAPLGCHPPRTASQPCAPEADPVPQPCKQVSGESVGHWIDAALADEEWWGAETRKEAQQRGGCFGVSDEPFDPLLAGTGAEER
jgi:hypothetical protein